jgi:predicted neutral ceramidase superfamily lipid hydrolase
MSIEMSAIRLLGIAQLVVFVASTVSERLLVSAVGSGSIASILVNVSKNVTRMRISSLVALLNSLAIVFLGVKFYTVFYRQYRTVALMALICFVAEAIVLAVSKIGAYGLMPLSREFVEAGAPDPSYMQALGDFLYHGIDRLGYDIHMLFFCLGGILWYTLLYSSRLVPRPLALWGLIAICLLAVPVVLVLYKRGPTPLMILGLPYAPFELVLAVWLIVKG